MLIKIKKSSLKTLAWWIFIGALICISDYLQLNTDRFIMVFCFTGIICYLKEIYKDSFENTLQVNAMNFQLTSIKRYITALQCEKLRKEAQDKLAPGAKSQKGISD